MKKLLLSVSLLIGLGSGIPEANAQLSLTKISTYHTGVFDGGATEIVAYDPVSMQLYSVNADASAIDIIDISDPNDPSLVSSIDLSLYGSAANSVAVSNGVVAAAVESDPKQDAGKVVLFQTDGTFIAEYTAGALPDMITFSHDGNYILTANEGEPSDDYSNDPEGSVTMVDISAGATAGVVTQIDFNDYDDKKHHLMNKGVRIYGPGASVSQDLEPEYIAILPGDSIAYVTCQENNAMIVINTNQAKVLDIYALGTKDHSTGRPEVTNLHINQEVALPLLGTPVYDGGQPAVTLGGFSGLFFDEANSTANNYVFYAIPDRGPNDGAVAKANVAPAVLQNLRPFKLPNYQGRIVKFEYNPTTQSISLSPNDQILLYAPDGTTPITGKGNIPGYDEVPVTYYDANTTYNTLDYTDNASEEYTALPYDRFGGDFEGILRDNNGDFWMCDEYRPAIYKFDPSGIMIDRYVAINTHQLANPSTAADTAGHYGTEILPEVYNKRRANRGFEAIAYDSDNDIVYAFIQSPLYNPGSVTKDASDVIRILGIDASNGNPVSEYVYLLERNKDAGYALNRVDKIGDAVYKGKGRFLLLERDSSNPYDTKKGKKYVFEFDLAGATNILGTALATRTDTTGGQKTLEMMTADELIANGVQPVFKRKVLNLPSAGYLSSDKPEGLALLPNGDLAVLNDNDFGLAGAGVTDNSTLGIISFGTDHALDASNDDGAINITNWPTHGYYMPDAMTAYEAVNGEMFILTANEGDARDYDGYSEEERVADLTLDATQFTDAATLQDDVNLGRLKTTSANGDIDNDGENEYVFSYGARSFSVFDIYGNLVWDSGDEFAQHISTSNPSEFNSTNDDNDSFDNRSDDKGTEPEAITTTTFDGEDYAFIGLERMGGIMVYNITDINNPSLEFFELNRDFSMGADSINNGESVSGDLGPENLLVIESADSPTNDAFLISANEISGTVTIYRIDPFNVGIEEQLDADQEVFTVFPNPATDDVIYVSEYANYDIFDIYGKLVQSVSNTRKIDVSNLSTGVYILSNDQHQSVKFVK